MAIDLDGVSNSSRKFNNSTDYGYEHRGAEHEHAEETEPADSLNVLVDRHQEVNCYPLRE